MKPRGIKVIEWTCIVCGTISIAIDHGGAEPLYCSTACKSRAARIRNRAGQSFKGWLAPGVKRRTHQYWGDPGTPT